MNMPLRIDPVALALGGRRPLSVHGLAGERRQAKHHIPLSCSADAAGKNVRIAVVFPLVAGTPGQGHLIFVVRQNSVDGNPPVGLYPDVLRLHVLMYGAVGRDDLLNTVGNFEVTNAEVDLAFGQTGVVEVEDAIDDFRIVIVIEGLGRMGGEVVQTGQVDLGIQGSPVTTLVRKHGAVIDATEQNRRSLVDFVVIDPARSEIE